MADIPRKKQASPFGRKRDEAPGTEEMLAELSRQLPFSDEAEKGVLSSILQDPADRVARVRTELPDDAFYHEANRTVYQEIAAMDAANLPIEPVALTNRLRDRKLLDRVGGAAAVTELFSFVPIPSHFDYYLKIVLDKWLAREAIHAHTTAIVDIQRYGLNADDNDIREVILNGEARVFSVVERSQKKGGAGPVHSNVVVGEVVDHVTMLQSHKGQILGVSTGWPDVDRAIGGQGLEPGDVFVIGARPKMGKTNVLCSMAKAMAVDQGIPTLILSLEMARRRLWNRIMFGGFNIATNKASTGFLDTREDMHNLQRATREMGKAPLWIHDQSMTTNDLRAEVRLWHRRHVPKGGRSVVMIDYLQLITAVTKIGMSEERHQIAEVMKVIHELKKELKITFLVLAQASRGAESNPRHEPQAKDFDGGSAIEKFLDYGAFIHRPVKYKRWKDLDDKAQEAFRKIVEPQRRANPGQWSPMVQVRDGMGQKIKNADGTPKMEWDIEQDWNEHALLLLCLNRNGDDGRIWLRFRPDFTRFDPRTTKLYSNNRDQQQVGRTDSYLTPDEPERGEMDQIFSGLDGEA